MGIVKELGANWNRKVDTSGFDDSYLKMTDRPEQLTRKNELVRKFLPEYMQGGSVVLDISCGAGVFLEIMRHYGNVIYGTSVDMFDFKDSQDVPHMPHDSNNVPFPFRDKTFDLVTCFGSMAKYDEAKLPAIFAEFFRLARRTVLLKLNSFGWVDKHDDLLQSPPDGWSVQVIGETMWKYEWKSAN